MSDPAVRQGFVDAGSVRSPMIEAGPERAPEAALFVHGNPGSWRDWEDLVRRTGAAGIRGVALDLPGFGSAEPPPGFSASVPAYASFLEDARRELGIERAHLVVHDFGGPIGLAWAAEHPDAFASVVILNAPPVAGYRWYPLAHVWRTPIAGELLHATLIKPTFELLSRRGHPRGLPQSLIDRMWHDYDRTTRRTVIQLYRATDARQMCPAPPELFAELDRPALVVWGPHDAYIPVRFAGVHREAFPNATFILLPDSGHFLMFDDPEGVAAAVVPFLERVTA